jgi:serine phosphatase RsbU (regulator of sigma subunit)
VLIASAAHPPLIHVTGAVWREVLGNGTFLGTPNAEIQLDTREVFLEPGDRLAAFTDGLCEQGGEGVVGCFDISRIGEALLSGGQRLPDAIDTLMLRFDAFRASRRVTDDLTVLAIECGPLGGAVTHR